MLACEASGVNHIILDVESSWARPPLRWRRGGGVEGPLSRRWPLRSCSL